MKKLDKVIDVAFSVLLILVVLVSFGNLLAYGDIMGGVVGIVLIIFIVMYIRDTRK